MIQIQERVRLVMKHVLMVNKTKGARVEQVEGGVWRLEIPQGDKGRYRLAQLDDYGSLPRRAFPWRSPFRMSLQARSSASCLPGTWGFGLWNNPFGMAILRGAELLRFPSLPNAAWFFFASPENYLSLRNDLPAHGNLAATFRSERLPLPMLLVGPPLAPGILLPPVARRVRWLARRWVSQDAVQLEIDPTHWNTYEIDWQPERVVSNVNNEMVMESHVSPYGPLGMVLWVDNQYAAMKPDGKIGFGTLPNPAPAWIEIKDLEVWHEGRRQTMRLPEPNRAVGET
jgi:hypothetical protein